MKYEDSDLGNVALYLGANLLSGNSRSNMSQTLMSGTWLRKLYIYFNMSH